MAVVLYGCENSVLGRVLSRMKALVFECMCASVFARSFLPNVPLERCYWCCMMMTVVTIAIEACKS